MKNAEMASIAPAMVLADAGVIMAGGSGPVKGILIDGVVIDTLRTRSCGSQRRRAIHDSKGSNVNGVFSWINDR